MSEFKHCEQDPMEGSADFTPQSLFDLTFSPLHTGPRAGEHFIRLACLIGTFGIASGQNQCGPKHPLKAKFDEKKKQICDYFLNRTPKIVLYKVKEGEIGNSNCGNTFK